MVKRLCSILVLAIGLITLAACGPSEEELAATSQVETAVSFAATETARPTETPVPTATYTPMPTDTPTITPTFTPTHTPSLTPTPEPATVYGNLVVNVVPYDERAEVPDPLGDLTLIFKSKGEEDEDIEILVTDPDGGFSIQLPEGSYTLDLKINAIGANLVTGGPKIQVPAEGCIYIGRVAINYNRLPPLSIVDQMGLAQQFAGSGGVSFTLINEGSMIHLSTEIDLPAEGEWVQGSEACLVSLASLD
jgi:hypothetical protein